MRFLPVGRIGHICFLVDEKVINGVDRNAEFAKLWERLSPSECVEIQKMTPPVSLCRGENIETIKAKKVCLAAEPVRGEETVWVVHGGGYADRDIVIDYSSTHAVEQFGLNGDLPGIAKRVREYVQNEIRSRLAKIHYFSIFRTEQEVLLPLLLDMEHILDILDKNIQDGRTASILQQVEDLLARSGISCTKRWEILQVLRRNPARVTASQRERIYKLILEKFQTSTDLDIIVQQYFS